MADERRPTRSLPAHRSLVTGITVRDSWEEPESKDVWRVDTYV
jgi:hypothetical protein